MTLWHHWHIGGSRRALISLICPSCIYVTYQINYSTYKRKYHIYAFGIFGSFFLMQLLKGAVPGATGVTQAGNATAPNKELVSCLYWVNRRASSFILWSISAIQGAVVSWSRPLLQYTSVAQSVLHFFDFKKNINNSLIRLTDTLSIYLDLCPMCSPVNEVKTD